MEDTLKPLDPERRAFRLVGGILVERTVKEVLPSVTSNRENVSTVHNVGEFTCTWEFSHSSIAGHGSQSIGKATGRETKRSSTV